MYEISIGCTDCEENATISAWIEASNHQILQAGLSLLLCHVQLVCLQLHCAEPSNGARWLSQESVSATVLRTQVMIPEASTSQQLLDLEKPPDHGLSRDTKSCQNKWQKKQDHVFWHNFWHNYRFHPKTIFNRWYHVNKWAKDLKQQKAGWFPGVAHFIFKTI